MKGALAKNAAKKGAIPAANDVPRDKAYALKFLQPAAAHGFADSVSDSALSIP